MCNLLEKLLSDNTFFQACKEELDFVGFVVVRAANFELNPILFAILNCINSDVNLYLFFQLLNIKNKEHCNVFIKIILSDLLV